MTTLAETLELTPADTIVPLTVAEETTRERLLTKHAPAWVASGAVHVLLVTTLIGLELFLPSKPKVAATNLDVVVATNDREDVEEKRLELNEDIGMDPELRANAEAERVEDVNVQAKVTPQENPGAENATAIEKIDFTVAPGAAMDEAANPGSVVKEGGTVKPGVGTGTNMFVGNPAFAGRSSASRSALVTSGGGNAESEAAVARGLVWLAKQQKANGSWTFDGVCVNDSVAATGLALLPFLAAGQTHKAFKDNKYDKTVLAGLKYLLKRQQENGSFTNEEERRTTTHQRLFEGSLVYSHAIATLAITETLGMSGDTGMLKYPAQRAVNFIVAWQNSEGGWNYTQKSPGGDPSIIGWQIQALHSAKLCKELRVPAQTLEKASKYLSTVASGPHKCQFSYNPNSSASPSLTAVGLLCRHYLDGWGPSNPGMIHGVKFLMSEKNLPSDKTPWDIYYYYYATQVVRNYGGKEWSREWNPWTRDRLIATQSKEGQTMGSWDFSTGLSHIDGCGRLGQTCLSLLTLEVYYRFLPTYNSAGSGKSR